MVYLALTTPGALAGLGHSEQFATGSLLSEIQLRIEFRTQRENFVTPDLRLLSRLSFLRRRSRAWVRDLIRRCQKKPSSVGDNFADKPKAEYRPTRFIDEDRDPG